MEHMALLTALSASPPRWTVFGWEVNGAVARWVSLLTALISMYLLLQFRSRPF
jgi:hypothetical protein